MGEIAFENGRFSDFQGIVTLALTFDRVTHTAYRHASVVDLYLHAKISLKSEKLFVDGQTYGRADGHLRPTLLGRLGGVDLII